MELTLEEANARLAQEGYPPIKRLPADPAALASWRRIVDAKRELDATGEVSSKTLLAISSFCHCYKCPSYPAGEPAVFCLKGKSEYDVMPMNCKCPSCHVYQMGAMHGSDYFCMTGIPSRRLHKVGGRVGAAKRFLEDEVARGNPGKRLPERLMAPPQLIERQQSDVSVPEKVPGAE